jgi:hypothetical protein
VTLRIEWEPVASDYLSGFDRRKVEGEISELEPVIQKCLGFLRENFGVNKPGGIIEIALNTFEEGWLKIHDDGDIFVGWESGFRRAEEKGQVIEEILAQVYVAIPEEAERVE